nr:S49 family peptidase [Acuticoccus mangrovi]
MTFASLVREVAVVPVWGAILNKRSVFFWSYEEIAADLALAVADPRVKRIVLDIDSPGGMVEGCADCAELIAAVSAIKPVSAQVRGSACSAAYWIAAAASPIAATQGSIVGSVGAVIHYVNLEPLLEKMGARVVEVVAKQSPAKRLDPDSDEGRAELQAIVDDAGERFVNALAVYRDTKPAAVLERFGQGRVFPAAAALERGMIDRVGGFDLAAVPPADPAEDEAGEMPAAAIIPNATTEIPVATETTAFASLTEAELNDRLAEAVTAATPDIVAGAAAAERARCEAILAAAGARADLAVASIAAGHTREQAFEAFLSAEREGRGQRLAAIAAADAEADVTPVFPSADAPAPAAADTPDAWGAEYDASAALKAEFATRARYVAFRKAETRAR